MARRQSPEGTPPAAVTGSSRSGDASRALPIRAVHTTAGFSGSAEKRLDPEVLGAHLSCLMRAARALCGSRENAEDLVQETIVKILSRPRFLRGEDELAYLMQALRNTFVTSLRTAGCRPRVVTTVEELNLTDRRSPEEAVITAQVFDAIAQLPERFRSALVAVDIAGLSYGEAARALDAREATITTRLHRARRRVARELDPERLGAWQSKGAGDTARLRAERPHLSPGIALSS